MAVNQASLARLMQTVDAGRSQIAALCFLVWDILITFDQEVEHIWSTPFQPLKLLYLFTRYYSLIALIILDSHTRTCQQWVAIEGVSAVVLEAAVEVISILRIYAMYTGSRSLMRVLIPGFIAQVLLMTISLAVALPRVMAAPHCIVTVFPIEVVVYTFSSIVFEGALFGLTVYKYYGATKEGWGERSLLNTLVRDSLWAFLLILIAMVANTLFFTLAPATLAALGFPWLLAVLGVLGPRLILNVRTEHARMHDSFIVHDSESSLRFAHNLSHSYVPVSTLEDGSGSKLSLLHSRSPSLQSLT